MECAKCEYLEPEEAPQKRTMWRCMAPGDKCGRTVAVMPNWCGKAQCWGAPAWCVINRKGERYEIR